MLALFFNLEIQVKWMQLIKNKLILIHFLFVLDFLIYQVFFLNTVLIKYRKISGLMYPLIFIAITVTKILVV